MELKDMVTSYAEGIDTTYVMWNSFDGERHFYDIIPEAQDQRFRQICFELSRAANVRPECPVKGFVTVGDKDWVLKYYSDEDRVLSWMKFYSQALSLCFQLDIRFDRKIEAIAGVYCIAKKNLIGYTVNIHKFSFGEDIHGHVNTGAEHAMTINQGFCGVIKTVPENN